MKTDSIFYHIFQTFPEAFFQIIKQETTQASIYDFLSVELKETNFKINGMFLPYPGIQEKPIYFVEVLIQKDVELYSRLFSDIFLYLYLHTSARDWQAVFIFAKRSIEPQNVEPYRVFLESDQVTRFYLDELEDVAQQPLGIGLMKLVVETKKGTPELVNTLIDKVYSEITDKALQKYVQNLIETIVLYKLPRISCQELAKMFKLSDFDVKKTRYYEEIREEVRKEEALQLVKRLLQHRISEISHQLQEHLHQLSVEQLENLAEALLDFSSEADLVAWLQDNSN